MFIEQRKSEVPVYAVLPIFLTAVSDLAWLRLWYFVKGHKLEASSCAELSISLRVLVLIVAFRTFTGTNTIRLLLLTVPTGVQKTHAPSVIEIRHYKAFFFAAFMLDNSVPLTTKHLDIWTIRSSRQWLKRHCTPTVGSWHIPWGSVH